MVFDDKYFTSVDTSSYFTANGKNPIYNASQGLSLGESFTPGITALQGVQLAANHGLPTVMLPAWEPKGGMGQGHGTAMDRISKAQENAIGEILSVNKMNFTMHAPIVDIMGMSKGAQGGSAFNSEQKRQNIELLKMNMKQADRISEKAGVKNAPFCVHTTNGAGTIGEKVDSGYRDKDDNIIWGTTNYMVDRSSGQVIPTNSDFQYMNINEGNKKTYKIIEGTETKNGTMALFEITPETRVRMANSTALNTERRKIADATATMNNLVKSGMSRDDPVVQDLQTTIATAKSQIAHLESPKFGTGGLKQQFVTIKQFSNKIVPKQIAQLAMTSLKDTKTHPIVSIENEPSHQLGSNPEILIDWVERGREEFANQLVKKEGYNVDEANKKAKELIGITLDTGHLNMLKSKINPKTSKPWTDEELNEQVKKIAATGAKLVHLADNIGELGQDTHMILGRGNANNEEYLKILKEHGFKGQAQIEAFTGEGDWDKMSAMANLMGLGAPMYSSNPMPRFTDVSNSIQTTYSMRNTNYGHNLPAIHFGQWGGPFAGLQSTFGASGGQRKDQFSGAPTE